MSRSLFLFVLLGVSLPAPAAVMPAFDMRVVDDASGAPVAGAHVLFHAEGREGTFTGHGGRYANLFAAETVTDADGRLHLPAQRFSTQPFFLNTNHEPAQLVILKSGYLPLVLGNPLLMRPTRADLTHWVHAGKTVRLRAPADAAELANHLHSAGLHASMPLGAETPCAWEKYPRFLIALDALLAEPPARFKEPWLPGLPSRNPRRLLLDNAAWFVARGCASPQAVLAAPAR